MKTGLKVAIVLGLFAGAVPFLKIDDGGEFDRGFAHLKAEHAAEAAVRKVLKDPSSAAFSRLVVGPGGSVCGYVNARNGFGGMTGPKSFVFEALTHKVTMYNGVGFVALWNQECFKHV